MDKNTKGKKSGVAPIARLAAFLRTSPERSNKD